MTSDDLLVVIANVLRQAANIAARDLQDRGVVSLHDQAAAQLLAWLAAGAAGAADRDVD